MSAGDADVAARVIERLLSDPAFRAEFRRDPATACRDAGLDDVAEEMSYGAGKAMHTLEIRESLSSVAGVMMAAALEGVGIVALVEGAVPSAFAAPGAVADVLSRVNLPAIDATGLRGSLAPSPDLPPAGAATASLAGDPDAPGSALAPAPVAPAPAALPDAPAGTASQAQPAPGQPTPAQAPDEAVPPIAPASETPAENVHYARAAAVEPGAPAAGVEPQPATAPLDPGQFGAEGTGGAPSAETAALLENKNVVFDKDGIADLKAGRIDPRVVSVLSKLSEDHQIEVSCMCSDHPTFTTNGSTSNHHYGRGVDIAKVDGMPVNASNAIAREIATDLSSLDTDFRPDEIGTPWAIDPSKGYFTDADHADHIHVGFKQAIDPAWQPPTGQAVTPAPSGVVPAAGGTMSVAIPQDAARKSGGGTLSIGVPEGPAAAGDAAQVGGVAADSSAAAGGGAVGGADTAQAGAKALAAVEEALKYKGTDYVWGGSTPETGFDCSGLVQWAYAKQGIEIPRVTYDQVVASNGTAIGRNDLAPGDLVFFSDNGDVHHVGMSLGGDRFVHAPSTGDRVKESSLTEDYYAGQFLEGRRFDATPVGAPDATPEPHAVQAAGEALARDAADVRNPHSMIFQALSRQEAGKVSSTVRFMPAVSPAEASPQLQEIASAAAPADAPVVAGSLEYPGNGATQPQLAAWLAAHAQKAGLPPELPVMAALVESNLVNNPGGHADSAGFFQMRAQYWNTGEYAGYLENPDLQAKWFIDQALAVKAASGDPSFGTDPSTWGEWIADIERPAVEFRDRYQERLGEARGLLAPKY